MGFEFSQTELSTYPGPEREKGSKKGRFWLKKGRFLVSWPSPFPFPCRDETLT